MSGARLPKMKFHCEDCNLNFENHEDWAVHLISRAHQKHVYGKVEGWIKKKCLKSLIIIRSGSVIDLLCHTAAKLLEYGTLTNLFIDDFGRNEVLFIAQYDNIETLEYALPALKNDSELSIYDIRRLTDVTVLEWITLLPTHSFIKSKESEESDHSEGELVMDLPYENSDTSGDEDQLQAEPETEFSEPETETEPETEVSEPAEDVAETKEFLANENSSDAKDGEAENNQGQFNDTSDISDDGSVIIDSVEEGEITSSCSRGMLETNETNSSDEMKNGNAGNHVASTLANGDGRNSIEKQKKVVNYLSTSEIESSDDDVLNKINDAPISAPNVIIKQEEECLKEMSPQVPQERIFNGYANAKIKRNVGRKFRKRKLRAFSDSDTESEDDPPEDGNGMVEPSSNYVPKKYNRKPRKSFNNSEDLLVSSTFDESGHRHRPSHNYEYSPPSRSCHRARKRKRSSSVSSSSSSDNHHKSKSTKHKSKKPKRKSVDNFKKSRKSESSTKRKRTHVHRGHRHKHKNRRRSRKSRSSSTESDTDSSKSKSPSRKDETKQRTKKLDIGFLNRFLKENCKIERKSPEDPSPPSPAAVSLLKLKKEEPSEFTNGVSNGEEERRIELYTGVLGAAETTEAHNNELQDFLDTNLFDFHTFNQVKQVVIADLERVIKAKFPSCTLHLFDPILTTRENLLEINIAGFEESAFILAGSHVQYQEARDNEKISFILRNILRGKMNSLPTAERYFSQIDQHSNGFLSSVKCRHVTFPHIRLSLTCCVSRQQHTRRQDFKLIEFYAKLNPKVREFLCFIHYWARHHGFIGFNKMKDYLLSLLAIMFLARKKIVPTLEIIQSYSKPYLDVDETDWLLKFCDNPELTNQVALIIKSKFNSKNSTVPLLHLAREFFVMYSNTFFKTRVICSWTAEILPKTTFTCFNSRGSIDRLPKELNEYKKLLRKGDPPLRTKSALSIQDPFELTFNLGSTVQPDLFKEFQVTCSQSATKVYKYYNGMSGNFMGIFREGSLGRRYMKVKKEEMEEERCNEIAEIPALSPRTPAPPPPPPSTQVTMNFELGCRPMVARFQSTLTAMNVISPIHDQNTNSKYLYFGITFEFREAFYAHMRRETDGNISSSFMFHKLARLWSTFAIYYIRRFWKGCYEMDTMENVIIEDVLDDKPKIERKVFEDVPNKNEDTFPVGYKTYYSLIECKGYLGQVPVTRRKIRANKKLQPNNFPSTHPFFFESEVTRFSKSLELNRKNGNVTWELQCEVLYEDTEPGELQSPKIVFILSGADSEVIQYVQSSIITTFHSHQLYLLKLWFDKKGEFLLNKKNDKEESDWSGQLAAEKNGEVSGPANEPTAEAPIDSGNGNPEQEFN